MPFIVEGQQGQRGTALEALDLRHLGDDVLAKLFGYLNEGGEPVIAKRDKQDNPEAKAKAAHDCCGQNEDLLHVGASRRCGGLEDGEGFLVNVAADTDVLDEQHEPVIDGLDTLDVELETLGLGDAGVGLDDFAFPLLDGGLDVFDPHLGGLVGCLELVPILAAEDLHQFLAARDIGVQFGDFGVFGPQIAAELVDPDAAASWSRAVALRRRSSSWRSDNLVLRVAR